MALTNPRDRVPVSLPVIRKVTGNDTLVEAEDTGTITLAISHPTGLFSGRIKATGLEAAPAALTVGWGFPSKSRKLPVYVNATYLDYAVNSFTRFAALNIATLANATWYDFFLTDPDDPKALPLIPDDEELLIYLTYTGTAGNSVLVEVEMEYESWADRAVEVA